MTNYILKKGAVTRIGTRFVTLSRRVKYHREYNRPSRARRGSSFDGENEFEPLIDRKSFSLFRNIPSL